MTDMISRAALIAAIERMPHRVEPIGGQNTKYVQLAEVVEWIAAQPAQGEAVAIPLSSDKAEHYNALCARLSVGKASEQDAITAIRDLCRDNERLALMKRSPTPPDSAELAAVAAEKEILQAAGDEYTLDHETETALERMGRKSAVRGMMVRLGLYDKLEVAIDAALRAKGVR